MSTVTHIVAETYQVLDKDRQVIKPWTTRVWCGREWAVEKTSIEPRHRTCRNCERRYHR